MQNSVLRRVVVHDRYQLELKLGYPLAQGKETRYRIDTYLFAPHSLGVNATSYPQTEFFRDIQHYVRMKTPSFQLHEVLDSARSPLMRAEQLLRARITGLDSADEETLRDSFRILRAVLKSATQSQLSPLVKIPQAIEAESTLRFDEIVTPTLADVDEFEQRYRALVNQLLEAGASTELMRAYRLTDESISVLVEDLLLRVYQLAPSWLPAPELIARQPILAERIRTESDYRTAQGYPSVLTKETRESYLRRVSALKKFTSSVLWLSTSTRREGATLEQVLFAIAAGIAMVFATLVAFFAQSVYGQFSLPVFVALVVAYMFKDRIKEQGRTWSSNLLSRHLYDYRTEIETQDGRRRLGTVREKVGYLKTDSIPAEVIATRGAGPHDEPTFVGHLETVLLYAKLVTLRKDAFAFLAEDGVAITAINDIMRFDIRPFLRKMDDPYEDRLMLKGDKVRTIRCHRTYHLNLVSVFSGEDGSMTSERTMIVLDRKGIQRIEQFDATGKIAAPGEPRLRLSELVETE